MGLGDTADSFSADRCEAVSSHAHIMKAAQSVDGLVAGKVKRFYAPRYCSTPVKTNAAYTEPQPESIAAPDAPGSRKFISKRKSARVLVAEDNAINQELIRAILKDVKGVSLTFAENGKEAINALDTGEVDLVLMDIHMPELAGDEAIKIIRGRETQYRDVPIFVLTADANPHHHEAFMNIGADDCISKPIDIGDLSRIVRSFLKKPAQETKISFAAHKLKQCFDQSSHIDREDRLGYKLDAKLDTGSEMPVDCTIVDLNVAGAGVVVDEATDIPSLFRLNLEDGALPVLCRLVWRIEHRAGFEFLAFKNGYQRRVLRSIIDDFANKKSALQKVATQVAAAN